MSKSVVVIAAAALAGLASCVDPMPPPPHWRRPPYQPRPYDDPYRNPDPYRNSDPYGDPAPQRDPDPQPDPEPSRGQYPTAKRTDNPDQVISPYSPYNVIDVAGFSSGQLARDPSNQKIFRVP